jgi:hypothetical protein
LVADPKGRSFEKMLRVIFGSETESRRRTKEISLHDEELHSSYSSANVIG